MRTMIDPRLLITVVPLLVLGTARDIAAQQEVPGDQAFGVTEGLDLIWKLQADPANVVISSVAAELKGFSYYDAEYRWPAVRGASGSITVTVPKAGTFHPAIVVYDSAGAETYELLVDGQAAGRFVASEDDRRQRVHFLKRPMEFKGGEKLTFVASGSGPHITEDILFLAQPPPVQGRKFELGQLEANSVRRNGQEQMRVTWITTWPSACTIKYGTSRNDTARVTEEQPVANHRVYLSGLTSGETYHLRVEAPCPDGRIVVSDDMRFTFQPPNPVQGKAARSVVRLKVENPHGFTLTGLPITSGVPFARGELGSEGNVRLLDSAGKEVAVQAKVTGRWQDGSVKWLLLSFLAAAEASSVATYSLEYGTAVAQQAAPSPLRHVWQQETLTVDTGPLRAQFQTRQSGFPTRVWFDANGDGQFADDEDLTGQGLISAQVHDTRGGIFTSNHPPELVEVEESGPVRTVVRVTGHYTSVDQKKFFTYTNRFVFYSGTPLLRVYHTWGNDWDGAEFAEFDRIALNVPAAGLRSGSWTVGLGDDQMAAGRGELALDQWRDDSFQLVPGPSPGSKHTRADGWLDLSQDQWGVTAAVRDFWQLYPKALRVTADGLAIDLCPDFPDGTYDGCTKLDEIKLYYYLMRGHYKVRRGVQRQHELLLSFHPGGFSSSTARQLVRAFQEPPIAVCAPERYCDTLVFGEILPATAGRSEEYEQVCEQVYRNTIRHRDGGREFGMLNFGDQWGERRVNWANGEYDHHHAFLLQFIRTGDRKWYFLGEQAARHAIDVDTCHHGPRRGGEWIHAMGHTGDYFTEPYEGSGIPRGGFTPSHTWTEGFCDWFFLSGDPTGAENAALVADYYDGAYLNNYDFTNCRDNGWHLILTLAAYRATGDPYYLNAARIIVERTLERQSPGGGWQRQMVPGHCHCMPRHRGEANFMLGVLANGLEEYYREVPDPRVASAVIGGARQAVNELWVDEANGFRYTSCPKMTGYTANNDMTAEVLFFAYRLGHERLHGEIAMRAMRAAFAGGIGSIAHLRWTPHIIFNMDLLDREGIGKGAKN